MNRARRSPALRCLALAALALGCSRESSPAQPAPGAPPAAASAPATYLGSAACGACHEAEYQSWLGSQHARAERELDPVLDAAAFAPRDPIAHGSLESRVESAEGQYRVLTQGPDGQPAAFPVVRAIGVEPLVQYLTEVRPGRLQVLALSYEPDTDEWFDVFGEEDRRPDEWGHWTGRGMVWNAQCADCHNTNLIKAYDAQTDRYQTRCDELGVGCEACHGPGSEHARAYAPDGPGASARSLLPWPDLSAQIDTCGSCHARRAELRETFVPGESMLSAFLPELPGHSEAWYPDGQVREEDYVYTSFLTSRMYQRGVGCLDCHEPHGGGLRDRGNALCLRCHAMPQGEVAPIEPERHAHHDPTQPGGQCIECHMPSTLYMQRDARRDHGFTIPDPALTLEAGVPNACNRCHSDQSASWAAGFVKEWYGVQPRPSAQRARLMVSARAGDERAPASLVGALASEAHPTWRAIFCGLLEPWSELPFVGQMLTRSLRDESPLVRSYAVRALRNAGPAVRPALAAACSDPVRAVRVGAALASAAGLDLGSRAGRELLEVFAQTADQPSGLAIESDFRLARGEVERAIELLQRAESWDPNAPALPRMLALALDAAGRPAQAAVACERACALDPLDPESWYALGLARGAAEDLTGAAEAIERSLSLHSEHARGWYNLGILRNSLHQSVAAEEALRMAIALEPSNADFRYALATVQREAGRLEAALQSAREALALDPEYGPARALANELERGGVRR